jgi:hypothetical protein
VGGWVGGWWWWGGGSKARGKLLSTHQVELLHLQWLTHRVSRSTLWLPEQCAAILCRPVKCIVVINCQQHWLLFRHGSKLIDKS